MGKVTNKKIGLIKILIMPSMTASQTAVQKPAMVTPGKR